MGGARRGALASYVEGRPPAPSGLTASVSGTSVTLNWTNGARTQGVDIYRNNVQIAFPSGPPSSYVDSGLAAGTYVYTVAGYNEFGVGPKSTGATAVVGGAPSRAMLGLWSWKFAATTLASEMSLASTLGVSAIIKGFTSFGDGTSWGSIAGWTVAGFLGGTLPAGSVPILAIPLCPHGTGLSAVAANLGSFRTLAANLPNGTICRLGWEFDGAYGASTFPWGPEASENNPGSPASNNGNTPAAFAAAFQAVVTAMWGVNGTLKFDFCSNTGSSTLSQLQAYYPGDAYTAYIGGDHYDNLGGGGNFAAMGPVVNLAAQRNKPLSCGEWGLNGGNQPAPYGDDPAFINYGAEVFNNPAAASARYGWPSYTPGYQSYFNDNPNQNFNSIITGMPNSLAAYKTDFG
jgi:hypothetical protein